MPADAAQSDRPAMRRLTRLLAVAAGLALVGTGLSAPAAASAASPAATVTGTLVDVFGDPLVGVDVFISRGGGGGATVTTNSVGRFTYRHSIHKGFPVWSAEPDIGAGLESITIRPVRNKTVSLGTIPWVSGAVKGDISLASSPSGSMWVSLVNAGGKEVARTMVDESTLRYSFSYSKKGNYAVRYVDIDQHWTYVGNTSNFATASHLAVSDKVSYERDITPVVKTGVLKGKLTPKSKKQNTAAISVLKIGGSELDFITELYDSGSFSFRGLPAGKYQLRVLNVSRHAWEYFRGSGKTVTKVSSKAKKIQVGTGTKNVGTFRIKQGYYEDGWD